LWAYQLRQAAGPTLSVSAPKKEQPNMMIGQNDGLDNIAFSREEFHLGGVETFNNAAHKFFRWQMLVEQLIKRVPHLRPAHNLLFGILRSRGCISGIKSCLTVAFSFELANDKPSLAGSQQT